MTYTPHRLSEFFCVLRGRHKETGLNVRRLVVYTRGQELVSAQFHTNNAKYSVKANRLFDARMMAAQAEIPVEYQPADG